MPYPEEAPHERRPHNVNPILSSAHVILAVKNFAAIPGVCHIGLGVTAENTMKVLRKNGIFAEAWPAQTSRELWQKLAYAETHHRGSPISHVVISAPSWVQPEAFKNFSIRWPETVFVQLNHSGCAYLSIDRHGMRNIREVAHLSLSVHNLRIAFNNERPQRFVEEGLLSDCLLLPNLYDPDSFVTPFYPQKMNGTLRVGSFGASRPWKNQLTAAEAAVMLAEKMGVNLEFYVNSKRPDGGERMIEARRELFYKLRGCELVEVPWELWPKFRKTISHMHILFSPSFDETFNVVTADGIAEGVPSVVTSAIEWTPDFWWCDPYSPDSIVRVAAGLLHDPRDAVEAARRKLKAFVATGIERWKDFLLKPA
jgi:glycosyltransferase involved in cell wall biosynthesis